MSSTDNDITLAMIMKHMLAMEQRIMTRIDGIESKIVGLETTVGRLEVTVDRNHDQTMRSHAQTSLQIENVDSRLDDVEVVQVPKLKKAVGIR